MYWSLMVHYHLCSRNTKLLNNQLKKTQNEWISTKKDEQEQYNLKEHSPRFPAPLIYRHWLRCNTNIISKYHYLNTFKTVEKRQEIKAVSTAHNFHGYWFFSPVSFFLVTLMQKSLEYWCNVTNFLCFTAEVRINASIPFKNALLFPPPQPIQCWNSG